MQTRVETISDTKLTQLICYHCGLTCFSDDIAIEEKYFCCNGCKIVYELITENDLCQYYNLNSNPGITQTKINPQARFGYLDDESIQRQLINFSDGHLCTVTFVIPNIHCSSCIWLLENLYKINPAITSSRVDFLKKELSLTYLEKDISLREVVELLSSIGYEPQINPEDTHADVEKVAIRSLYLKIGVAGFAFANIMLLSLPGYLSGGNLELQFKQFFGYLNILLALPVFFYSSLDFFRSALSGLRHKAVNIDLPISLGILTLFSRSVFEIIFSGGAGFMDSFVALVFLLLIGKLFQKKTYDRLSFERDYKSYFPISVTLKRHGKEESVPLSKLKKGNRIVVRNQELIPADAVLISGDGFIDYSFVTGESSPVSKQSGDLIYAGGRQIGSAVELEVVKKVSQSYLTRLWDNDAFKKKPKSQISSVTDIVAKYFTLIVISIATAACLYWLPQDVGLALNAFTAVLIIACPCALALSSPFALGNTLRIFGKMNFFLKNVGVIETLAKVDSIVFDKTGTLTKTNQSKVRFVQLNGKADFNSYEKRLIKSLVHHSTHPLSRRIDQSLPGKNFITVQNFQEEPGQGISGNVDGHQLRIGSSSFVLGDISANRAIDSTVTISIDGEIVGGYQFQNIYREGLEPVIKDLGKKYDLALLSGDNEKEKNIFESSFRNPSALFFNQSPYDKLDFIREKQKNHRRVLMVGDGLNDAGALKQSDVGIAISDNLTAFSPACDAILDSQHFPHLADFIKFSKVSVKIIFISFVISFFYNLVGLSFAVQGTLSPLVSAILMPLSSISIVVFATGATRIAARVLGLK